MNSKLPTIIIIFSIFKEFFWSFFYPLKRYTYRYHLKTWNNLISIPQINIVLSIPKFWFNNSIARYSALVSFSFFVVSKKKGIYFIFLTVQIGLIGYPKFQVSSFMISAGINIFIAKVPDRDYGYATSYDRDLLFCSQHV